MKQVSTEDASEHIKTTFVNSAQDLCIGRVELLLARCDDKYALKFIQA